MRSLMASRFLLVTSMPLRILFVDHSGALGGAELFLLDLVRPYADTSTVITFESGRFTEQLEAQAVPYRILESGAALQRVRKNGTWMQGLYVLPALARTAQAVAQQARSHDVIVANSQKALLPAAWAARRTGTPLIWMVHDLLTPEHFGWMQRQLVTRIANASAALVAVNSRATARAFTDGGGTGPIIEIPNGLDAAPFERARQNDSQALRTALNLPHDAPVLGVFSRLAAWKGQHVLLEALHDLPTAHVLIVGEAAFPGDKPYAEQLRTQAHHPALRGRVHFAGHRADIPDLMAACTLIVHTSTAAEPFGRVVAEGLLARRPVVATDAGGVPEIIRPQHSGLLVPPGDSAALAAACQSLLDDPDWAATLAHTGAADVRTRYGLKRMHAQFEEALRRVHPSVRIAA